MSSMKSMNAREWLQRLVAFDTTSRNSNLAMIEAIRDALASQGIQSELTYAPEGGKANLFATLPACDGATQGGIVLSGHTDVVPRSEERRVGQGCVARSGAGRLQGQ